MGIGDLYINGGHGVFTLLLSKSTIFFLQEHGYKYIDSDLYCVGPPDGFCTYKGSDLNS